MTTTDFPYDDCEFSEDDMLWYCQTGEMHPVDRGGQPHDGAHCRGSRGRHQLHR
ncbi:MAG: hypothetical protein CM15mP6_2970 [Methanobacteriota archaeon]|nr:MAG: hypothetical protein CM15mP6_2970 [Euryarchaeota archaeon]